ncbi:MAG: restriction endonuclease subunit S [Deltaproteobacteria bacterium]|nr:restriction endonuclease subunit S [Deltaproteobacteria bacterium]
MITRDTFPQLLEYLGFIRSKTIFRKEIGTAMLIVDMDSREIQYPETTGFMVNERQSCNFSKVENFVVLECVHRLLEKGYKPEHMELEAKWKLGHGASGGRADILIKDNAGKPLLLIECKTPGREFDKAWRNTLQDGGQLFSYAQQIPETQFLCLYCSDCAAGEITYQSNIIAYRDNDRYLEDNPSFKAFREPGDAKAKYAVWRDTYKLDYTTKGIFEDNIQPYHIGKDKYSLADLHSISASDQQKKYHEFATILRQHNVSGRENAFDKLVNLFLCKLVDELEHPDDLKFVWKGVAYDSHFDLMDRLQQLYQAGMGKFLGEKITYINRERVFGAMRFIRQDLDVTQREVWKLFVEQKFFTNNDFSFIDVHNEKLFYQNAEVLLKILQMWQDIRLTSDTGHNQFLGDMFEFFLDQGVKQSEGQYFTPMPICRFILMSLPLESIVKSSAHPPKAIDYACGAGHFLTELALQLKPLVAQHTQADMADYHRTIYGMEKEYRLSKVAKVSAFMYGQQEINICYGDALINRHSAFSAIQDNSFDLLVANPPFSVRGFLETLLEEERNNYTLTDAIDKLDTNNSIETFFIERAKQLLKAGGVAGIILPASVLSNGGRIYTRTREILLQYFDIIAIADFGSGTFGKTGTNTVTLFLRRKATAPNTADHYRERVNEWFATDDNQPVYRDAHLIDQYAAHIGVAADDYKTVLTGAPNAALLAHETFIQYRTAFDASTEIVNLKKQKGFKGRPHAEQQAELDKRFLAFVQGIERDKLLHFVLASQQPNRVLIIKSPGETKAQRQFLGYFWSDSKGDEGIKIIRDANGHHLTPLYDETNRDNPAKISQCITDNFNAVRPELVEGRDSTGSPRTDIVIPPELSDYASTARLVDMLDFSRLTFEKQFLLSIKKAVEVQSKWPLSKLSDLVEIISGGTPGTNNATYWDGDIPWLSVADFSSVARFVHVAEKSITIEGLNNSSTKLLQAGDIIISARGTVGALAQLAVPMAFNQSCYGLRSKTEVTNDYIFYLLKREIQQLKSQAFGSKFDAITIKTFEEVKIPLPSLEIQHQIVAECEAVDAEAIAAQANIATSRLSIEIAVNEVILGSFPKKKLGDSDISLINPSKTEIKQVDDEIQVSFIEMAAVSESGFIMNAVNRPLKELRKGSYTYFAENDIILAKITPCMENGKCAVAVGLTNGLGMGSSEFHVIRANPANVMPKYLFLLLNRQSIRTEAAKIMTGASGHRRVPASFYETLQIPVPPLAEQKRLVTEVEKLEQTISAAQNLLAAAPARKQAVMQRYL